MTPVDPFSFKRYSKLNPARLWFTAKTRIAEKSAFRNFDQFPIPRLLPALEIPNLQPYETADTAVTPQQMQVLIQALLVTETLEASRVEIGVYRGVTTSILAAHTTRDYVAVDPYIGYGGAQSDFEKMQQRVGCLPHVRHLRMTSGEAAASSEVTKVSMVFIDAVHDYVNASVDGFIWGRKLVRGGLLAFHDTDNIGFAGVQRAVWELLHQSGEYALFAHVDGLVVLQRI